MTCGTSPRARGARVGEPQNFDGAEDGRQRIPSSCDSIARNSSLRRSASLSSSSVRSRSCTASRLSVTSWTGAEQSDGAAACVLFDVGPGVDPPDDAIGPNDPVFLFESLAARDTGLCRRQQRLAILGVDGVDETLVVDRDAARGPQPNSR